MNTACLFLTSACVAGYQPPAAIPPAAAPVAAVAAPCGGCDSTCGDSCQKVSLLDKIRARLHRRDRDSNRCCDATPRCRAPRERHSWRAASSCNTCQEVPSCGPKGRTALFDGHLFQKKSAGCGDSCGRTSFLDKCKAKFARKKSGGCDNCGTASYGGCTGCGAAPYPAPVTGGTPAPMPMGEKK